MNEGGEDSEEAGGFGCAGCERGCRGGECGVVVRGEAGSVNGPCVVEVLEAARGCGVGGREVGVDEFDDELGWVGVERKLEVLSNFSEWYQGRLTSYPMLPK